MRSFNFLPPCHPERSRRVFEAQGHSFESTVYPPCVFSFLICLFFYLKKRKNQASSLRCGVLPLRALVGASNRMYCFESPNDYPKQNPPRQEQQSGFHFLILYE